MVATTGGAADIQGWRTSDGKLYFGVAPPPGSTRIEAGMPTPSPGTREQPVARPAASTARQPTATPRASATPAPRSRPTIVPEPTTTPRDRPAATRRVEPAAASAWYGPADCRDAVQIRDSRPTIDFEADVVTVSGELAVVVGPVKDVEVCIGGTCKPVAGARIVAEGETVPFFVAASRHRPAGLTVRCSVRRGR